MGEIDEDLGFAQAHSKEVMNRDADSTRGMLPPLVRLAPSRSEQHRKSR